MRFALVDQAKDFPVYRLCKMLGISQSGYFAWKDRPASRRQRDDMVMLAHVRSALAQSNGTYGSSRMTRELKDDGFAIGRRRTARLMRENGLRARQSGGSSGRRTASTPKDGLGRSPPTSSTKTSSYIWTREGWLYLAVVIDPGLRRGRLCSPAASSAGPSVTGCTAIWRSPPCERLSRCGVRPRGLSTIRDRGSQYCSMDFQAELRRIRISMSGKGNCYDNAMVETFFKTIKSELVWRTVFYTRAEAGQAIARYIDGFYNPSGVTRR